MTESFSNYSIVKTTLTEIQLTKLLLVVTMVFMGLTLSKINIVCAQEIGRNSVNIYVGLFEFNLNYERNISQQSRSHTNLRLGLGYGDTFLTTGSYINPALVHLIGRKNSHVEIDVGLKYQLKKDTDPWIDPQDSSYRFAADIFLGYRYERPEGGFLFRFGLNYPSYLNMGIGIKF